MFFVAIIYNFVAWKVICMDDKSILNCIGAGEQDCSDMHYWGPGVRQVYIIHFVTKGKGYFEMCGKQHTVKKGQAFLSFPGETIYYYPDENDPYSYKWIDFNGSIAGILVNSTAFTKQSPVSTVLDINEVTTLFDNAHKNLAANCFRFPCEPSMMKVLAFFIEKFPSKDYNLKEFNYLDRAIYYIQSNLHKSSLKVQQVADYIGICRAHLYRLFFNKFNTSPSQYIINQRMKKAEDLLKNTNLPIKAISISVGYCDALYFSLCFKRFAGNSPKNYRENL